MDQSLKDQIDLTEAWGIALEYKVDVHLKQIEARKLGKMQEVDRLEKLYKKAERVETFLADQLLKL